MKTLINKKRIGEKQYFGFNDSVKVKVVESESYRTNGEELILVKNTNNCKIILDSTTTSSVSIKTLTNTIVKPFIGRIDEEYDEILMNKGACVEFYNIENTWYIISSDGLKLDN